MLIKSALAVLLIATLQASCSASGQLSVGLQHDISAPTYGLQGPTSSLISYDDKNGLKLGGTVNEIFGPPIKMMNGFGNMFHGSNMAGVGNSLKSGSAVLGIDAKLLEAAGGAHLLHGGLLLGGSAAKTGLATAVGGLPGKKISSIIEMPVKVVAMKDLVEGKTLVGLGKMKETEAQAAVAKGATMVKQGEQMKKQGMDQVLQGAQEGMQNIGNMVQQVSGNAATAVKLLPIIFDLPTGQSQQQQQQQQEPEGTKTGQQALGAMQHSNGGALTGGSLFGGLSSLFPSLANDPLVGTNNPLGGLFNGHNQHNGYAAVLNSTNPFANLLMGAPGQGVNPFLLPLNSLAQGPLGQSLMAKQPGSSSLLGGQTNHNYNLFPGLRMSETVSSQLPNLMHLQQEPKGHPEAQQQQQQQSQASNNKV